MPDSLYEIITARAQRFPDAIAIGGQEGLAWRTLTSQDLLDQVDRLAGELKAGGVRPGDRVVLWVPNGWRTPVYLFAIWKLGAIVVPFDQETNPEAGARILDSVEPRLIITGYDGPPAWAEGRETIQWWDPGDGGSITSLAAGQPADPNLATIVFTSGTTGTPKGCQISHLNLLAQVAALDQNIPLGPDCRLASILPLSHLFELTCGLIYPLSQGAAVHYVPSRRAPDIIRVFTEQRISHLLAVPQLLSLMGGALEGQLRQKLGAGILGRMLKLADRLPMAGRRKLFFLVHRRLGGHLRVIASGGAALAAETQIFWERLGVTIVQGYGTSECSPVIACGTVSGTPVGSVGKPLRGVEVRLTAEGEVQVKGPSVMSGYWKNPEKTAEVLQDGWYSTGDLAIIEPDGNIRLSGRAKDLIVLPSGMNVWPVDVEDALRTHPAVQDAAIILVPSAGGGATLHAYLLPAGDPSTDPVEIVSTINGKLAQHQRLATASWWPDTDFPRTTGLGKVRRHLLPPPSDSDLNRVETVLTADDPVGQTIAAIAKVNGVRSNQTLGQLGLDSLSLVNLALAIEEKTGKAVADGDLTADLTVDQVRQLVANAPDASAGSDVALSVEIPEWPFTWGRHLRWVSFPFDWLYAWSVTKTLVSGREHLTDLPPNAIFASTHHSFADVPLIRHGLTKTPFRRYANRLIVTAAAAGVGWKSPLARYGILAFALYPLEQLRAREESLRRLAALARKGYPVLIFPQGTHAEPEQEIESDPAADFKPGVAHLAEALDAPVVPVGIAGTETMMPPDITKFKGRTIAGIPVSIARGPLAIAFGAPLRPEKGEEPRAFARRVQESSYALTRRAEAAITSAGTAP